MLFIALGKRRLFARYFRIHIRNNNPDVPWKDMAGKRNILIHDLKNVTQILQKHKEELNRKYGVIEIGIFGSYVNNTQDDASDIDILVDFHKAIDLFTFVNLKNYLSDLLSIKVDLVMKKALRPKIGQRILREFVSI